MHNIDEINSFIQEYKQEGNSVKEISDGHHTFEELYHHRILLFATICNLNQDVSWKSKKHHPEDDQMFNGSFIAGINTPLGEATYHIKLKYWNIFNIKEIEHSPKFTGYTPEESIQRILSLTKERK